MYCYNPCLAIDSKKNSQPDFAVKIQQHQLTGGMVMTETVVSIQNAQFPDQYSLTLLFVVTVAVLILFIEIGFRLGSWRHGKAVKAQASQARAVMGTTLGLLAFMLAFTFATAQTHFETRVANLAEEARLAHNAFLHAEFLAQADHKRARELLR